MKVKIKIEGKINDTYTFQQPEEGNILDELAAISEEMKAGRIDKVEIEEGGVNMRGTGLFINWESGNKTVMRFRNLKKRHQLRI